MESNYKIKIKGAELYSLLRSTSNLVQSWLPFTISDVERMENSNFVMNAPITVKTFISQDGRCKAPIEWDDEDAGFHYKITKLYSIKTTIYDPPMSATIENDYIVFSTTRDTFTLICDFEVSILTEIESLEDRITTLTEKLEQYQQNARENILAKSASTPVFLYDEQNLSLEQQRAVRSNIDIINPEDVVNMAENLEYLPENLDTLLDTSKIQQFPTKEGASDEEKLQTQKAYQANGRRLIKINPVEATKSYRRPVAIDEQGRLWTQENINMSLKQLLQSGLAPLKYSLGDEIRVRINKPSLGGMTELVFEVLGFDYDTPVSKNISHTMSLGLKNVLYPKSMIFDNKQALFYLAAGLPKGKYSFKSGSFNRGFNTSDQEPSPMKNPIDLPRNCQLVPTSLSGSAPQGLQAYTNTYTPVGDVINIIFAYAGAYIGEYDNTSSTDVFLENNRYRVQTNTGNNIQFGNNNYNTSPIHTYLNSIGAHFIDWWNQIDDSIFRRPQPFEVEGFLYGIESEFRDLIVPVYKRTRLIDGSIDVVGTEGVFLPSAIELGFNYSDIDTSETSYGIGNIEPLTNPYPLYSNLTDEALRAAHIKYDLNGNAADYMLRTIRGTNSPYLYYVDIGGGMSPSYPNVPKGISPVVVIGA